MFTQVCQHDRGFYSYVEMPISCRSSSVDYPLVRSVSVVKPASDLATFLRIASADLILLATFSRSEHNSDRPTDESAVCLYRLSDIRQKFTENIQKCFQSGVGLNSRGQRQQLGAQFSNRMCVSMVSKKVVV